jgi:peptidyl-Lys metalloendopeptidase
MRRFEKGVISLLTVVMGMILFCAPPGEPDMEKGKPIVLFECSLEIKGKNFPVGEPVNLHFSLRNKTDRALYVLRWYTPLEGLYGNIFKVVRDSGEQVPYRGIMAKRGRPTAKDYIPVEPGKVLSAEVDLSTSYDLSKVGHYHVQFIGQLHDVTEQKQEIPRKPDDHQPQKIQCNAVDFHIIANDQ